MTAPKCTKLAFNETFKNFQDKITAGVWAIYDEPVPGDGTTPVNDGKIVQECDGVVLDSHVFTTAFPHPITDMHYAVVRNVPFAPLSGVCVEFTASQNTKNIGKVHNTTFDPFYECSGLNPYADFRLANSSVGLINIGDPDQVLVQIAFTKKQVYLLYGVINVTSNLRDRFLAAIPIGKRRGKWDEKLIYSLCLNYNGSLQVFRKDDETCQNECVAYIPNVGVPPLDRKYIVAVFTRTVAPAPPIFLSEPITFTNLTVIAGNFSGMRYMEPLACDVPTTVLYNVTGDLPANIVYRYLCRCGSNDLLPADSVVTLADGTIASTAALNFGQGAAIKLYNLTACYF